MRHFRKTMRRYAKLNFKDTQKPGCTFCNEDDKTRIIEENDTMIVMKNRVPYDVFTGQRVIEHLMVLPKRHVETFSKFTKQEMLDQMKLIGEYESKGYDIYARGVGSISRSVKHQHTHIIKLVQKKPNAFFFIKKPYFLITW